DQITRGVLGVGPGAAGGGGHVGSGGRRTAIGEGSLDESSRAVELELVDQSAGGGGGGAVEGEHAAGLLELDEVAAVVVPAELAHVVVEGGDAAVGLVDPPDAPLGPALLVV